MKGHLKLTVLSADTRDKQIVRQEKIESKHENLGWFKRFMKALKRPTDWKPYAK